MSPESLLVITGDRLWYEPVSEAMAAYEIDTDQRVAFFLAQMAHESGGFKRVLENLNYSAEGLRKTFRKYFTTEQAELYAHRPRAIANRVYANRMGNGNEASDEGWLYRGRGLVQLTGRDNYEAFGNSIGENLIENPSLVSDHRKYSALAGAWFWDSRGCNALADAGDFAGLTRKINGGMNGYDDRLAWLERTTEAIA